LYTALVLITPIVILYGCELRFLREGLFAKLRTFHSQCCRAMCRAAMSQAARHHTQRKQLHRRLVP
jgi:hypothetical protein